MNNQNNKNYKYENQQYHQIHGPPPNHPQSNYGQPNPNQSNFSSKNTTQQQYQSQSPYGQTSQNTGLSTNYTSSNTNNSKIKLISKGSGINQKEFDVIVSSCIKIQDSKTQPPFSIKCIQKIKEKIGGEWFVFVRPLSEKNYDFYISYVKSKKYLSFTYEGNLYNISLIRG